MFGRRRQASPEQQCGSYLRSDTALYRVEETYGDHVLVEDCRSGELIHMHAHDLDQLEPVVAQPAASGRGGQHRPAHSQ